MAEKNISVKKSHGRFYTPDFIVKNILDLSGYYGSAIIGKHVIDNSCGDGAFLVEIVERYCLESQKAAMPKKELKNHLETYIHGIEIDQTEHKKCIENVSEIAYKFGVENVSWDILSGNTLSIHDYDNKMDFVLGNPPYIRVHNLGDSFNNIKNFSFAQTGMTDMYIVFYEIGLKMLNTNGVLGYITPSSFYNSVAGKYMRRYFIQNNLLATIVDLKHFQAFSATTYTTIVILKNNRKITITDYYQFDTKNLFPYFVDSLTVNDYYISDNFYFDTKHNLLELRKILNFKTVKDFFSVKNGFATLADSFFIGNLPFDEYTIPVIKASTGKKTKCFFPYRNNKLIPYKQLVTVPEIEEYFKKNEAMLKKRSLEKSGEWYGFGRSQGINDVYKCKYSINALIRTIDDLKIIKCGTGVGVYSGLYILTDIAENELKAILCCNDFITYISMLGKYKSGGYYTFSSKDLKNYLEYKYSQRNGFDNEQFTIFGNT